MKGNKQIRSRHTRHSSLSTRHEQAVHPPPGRQRPRFSLPTARSRHSPRRHEEACTCPRLRQRGVEYLGYELPSRRRWPDICGPVGSSCGIPRIPAEGGCHEATSGASPDRCLPAFGMGFTHRIASYRHVSER